MGGLEPEKCEASEQSPETWSQIPPCPGCGHAMLDLDLGSEMGSNPMRYECPDCEITFVGDANGLLTEVDGLLGRTQ
jgi:Zn finger protein HypA/HybF involved in hydrogenase expression